ncbi:MAG: aromatic amino acid transport family protein [Patescibacteria group bacterium]
MAKSQPSNGKRALPFLRATALVVGTAIGAGIFGLPYVFSQSGASVGVGHLVIIFLTVLMTMLAFGEVASHTPGRHQITGYTKIYLGRAWEIIALVSLVLGVYGALIAYILGVGTFVHALSVPYFGGIPLAYSLIFWMIVSSILFFGLRRVAKAESVLVVLLLLVVVTILLLSTPHIDIQNLLFVPEISLQPTSWVPFILPFGVVLFAFGASTAVPETVEYLRESQELRWTRRSIILGMTVPAVVYLVFVLAMVGVTGAETSESAIVGLGQALGTPVLIVGSILGTLTMTTSFLALGVALLDVFRYDFKLSHLLSWTAVIIPPVVIVLAQVGSFIDFIGLAGSLVGGIDGIIILLMYLKLRQKNIKKAGFLHIPPPLVALGMIVYALGILSEVYTLAFKWF